MRERPRVRGGAPSTSSRIRRAEWRAARISVRRRTRPEANFRFSTRFSVAAGSMVRGRAAAARPVGCRGPDPRGDGSSCPGSPRRSHNTATTIHPTRRRSHPMNSRSPTRSAAACQRRTAPAAPSLHIARPAAASRPRVGNRIGRRYRCVASRLVELILKAGNAIVQCLDLGPARGLAGSLLARVALGRTGDDARDVRAVGRRKIADVDSARCVGPRVDVRQRGLQTERAHQQRHRTRYKTPGDHHQLSTGWRQCYSAALRLYSLVGQRKRGAGSGRGSPCPAAWNAFFRRRRASSGGRARAIGGASSDATWRA